MNISGGALKFLALLLAFVLGFLACAGSLFFGGWYIYKNVSYETLQSWGVPLPSTDAVLDTHADVRLTALTLSDLVAELSSLSGYGDRLTMQLLVDRYGVKMPEEMSAMLPEVLMEVSLQTLFSADGISYILDNTTVEYLFNFLPSDTLSAPARNALKDKSLSDLMGGELSGLLEDVKLGYFLEVTYEQQDDGSYRLVYADPENPTTNELLAPLSVGPLLDAAASGGDLLKVVKDDIGDCSLKQLASDASALEPFLKDKTLGDIIVYDEAKGKHVLAADELTKDLYLGDVMDYEPVYGDPDDPERITAWLSGGEAVTALEAAMADITLEEFMSSEFEMSEAVGHLYLGEVMGYVKEVESETYALAAGDEDEVHHVWYEKELDEQGKRVPLTGVNKLVAGILLGDVLRGNKTAVTSVFDDMYLGEIMDLHKKEYPAYGEDGVYLTTYTVWYENAACTARAADIFGALAEMTVSGLNDGLPETRIGATIGLVEHGGKWYEAGEVQERTVAGEPEEYVTLTPAKGIMTAFAGLSIDDMSDNETVRGAVNDISMAEVLGYTEGRNGEYYDADVTNEEAYTYDKETKTYYMSGTTDVKAPISGIMGELAPKAVGTLEADIDDMRLGVVLGWEPTWVDENDHTKGVVEWKDAEAMNYTYDEATDTYYDENGDPISGVLATLVDAKIGEMQTEVENTYIGEIMGWVPDWNDPNDHTQRVKEWYVNKEMTQVAKGLAKPFADMTLQEMSDDDLVEQKVESIYVYEVMGYTEGKGRYYEHDITNAVKYEYREDKENYYDKTTGAAVPYVTGIMGALAGEPISDLDGAVTKLKVQEVFSEAERSRGILSLIDPETCLYASAGKKGLAETVSDAVATAPIGQLLKRQATDGEDTYTILPDVTVGGKTVSPQTAELLVLDSLTCDRLEKLDLAHGKPMGVYYVEGGEGNPIKAYAYYWQSLTINELLDYIVQSLSPTP